MKDDFYIRKNAAPIKVGKRDATGACILPSFGYGPLECPECGKTMLFMELYYNHQRVPLEKLYEKAMSKAHRKRSPA